MVKRSAWKCSCGYWTTVGRLDAGLDECEVDAEGLICPDCGTHLEPGLHSTNKNVGIFSGEERRSWAMAVHPDQIPDAMKKWPGSKYDSKTGQLIYKGRTGKKVAMKARGYIEL